VAIHHQLEEQKISADLQKKQKEEQNKKNDDGGFLLFLFQSNQEKAA